MGAVLQQKSSPAEEWRPLGFFSQSWRRPSCPTAPSIGNSTVFMQPSGISAIRHFRHQACCRFKIWTDHKPITFALSKISDSLTARQRRQLSYVAEFTSSIIHIPGCLNIVADLLSRPPQGVPAPGPATVAGVNVPYRSLATSQAAGGTTRALFTFMQQPPLPLTATLTCWPRP